MTGLFGRGCLKKIKRSELPMGTRVISSRFHYKIKRHSAGEHKLKAKRLKVRLVVQGVDLTQGFIQAELPMERPFIFSPPPGHCQGARCGLFGPEAYTACRILVDVCTSHGPNG